MSGTDLPRILVVDDENADQHAVGLGDHARVRALHPNDIEANDLDWADLVLMDFVLDHWGERDELDAVSLRPPNGLALAAVLREHADTQDGEDDDYTAFAIHTAHIGKISRRLHTTNRAAHVVARLNNLEWVFEKSDGTRFERSTALAAAVRTISGSWQDVEGNGVETALERFFGLRVEGPWQLRALDDVVLCQVPLSEFSARTNGLLFLRWLLHAILPYPTFLWGKLWVAAALRLSPESLGAVLLGESELAKGLGTCRYQGVLGSFLGPRWWRAGVEQFVWNIRAAGARDSQAFHRKLESLAEVDLEPINLVSPVVCVGRDLTPVDDLSSLEDAVRIVPDLWPAYADSAYANLAIVRQAPELAAIVHPLDRERVEPDLDEGDNDGEG